MKTLVAGLVTLAAACTAIAQDIDINQPQSPPRPAPAWLKLIDQGTLDPRLKGYIAPEGIQVEIVAEFPTVTNPVGMTFGPDGTLYVLEWRPDTGRSFPEVMEKFTYKDGTTRQVATMKKQVADVVKVLHLGDRGTYDRASVILEDELPSSILVHDGWLYLSGRGTVRRYRQSKPGGPYDIKEVIAQGFCGFHHHQVSGLTIGNDGWLYITSGDDDNHVEGSDGSRATVLRTGAVFRCRPDGSRMHIYATGFRNPYRDVVFDTVGNMFHVDNDNEDGSKFTGCRLMYVGEEADFGWRLYPGARCCRPDPIRGAAYGEAPGKMPPLLKTGRGAPAGLLSYDDTFLPPQYQGLLYYPDVYRRLIRAYRVAPRGAGFQVAEEFEFLKSDDPLFRPCQMVVGPDGAIYVCDWRTDHGGAGQLWGDGKHGRIYRLRWAGTDDEPAIPLRKLDSWARIAGLTDEQLLKELESENASDRQRAQHEIIRRGKDVRADLLKILFDYRNQAPSTRVAALGVLQSFWNTEVRDQFLRLLRDPDPDIRRLVADALAHNCGRRDNAAHNALIAALSDEDLAVRRAVYLAIGQIGDAGAADALINVFQFSDGRDVWLHDGLIRALERTGAPGIQALLDVADSGQDSERNKVVEAFLSLRTRPAAEALPRLLANIHLTVAQRAALIHSYTNYLLEPPLSLDPLLEYLERHDEPPFVLREALTALTASGPVKSARAQEFLLRLLDDPDPLLRPQLFRALEEARPAGAVKKLVDLVTVGRLPDADRAAAVKALGALKDREALAALKEILADRNASAALVTEALRALTAIDATAAQEQVRALLTSPDPALVAEAVNLLGASPAGARHVGEQFVARKLPREVLPQVGEAIRKHAGKDPELARLLTEVMKGGLLLSLDQAEVERVRALVRAKGDPRRGRTVYLNTRLLACARCHTLEGVGGNIGPDLTRIWDTHSVEKIMESMIDPSKEIKEGFQSYRAVTRAGLVHTGLKVAQNADEVVLRDADGRETRIAAKDLEELAPSPQSLMPDNVVSQLRFEEFLDLVAFLKDRAAQESLRGMALEVWAVGPFPADLKAAAAPERDADPARTYDGQRRWQPVQADSNGLLNLASAAPAGPAAVYALTYVFAPEAQKVELLVGGGDQVRLWLAGQLVFEQADARLPRPDADRVEVALARGWNPILVKVVRQKDHLGVYLRLTGGSGLRVAPRPM